MGAVPGAGGGPPTGVGPPAWQGPVRGPARTAGEREKVVRSAGPGDPKGAAGPAASRRDDRGGPRPSVWAPVRAARRLVLVPGREGAVCRVRAHPPPVFAAAVEAAGPPAGSDRGRGAEERGRA